MSAPISYPDWRASRVEITRAIASLEHASREDDRDIIHRRHDEQTADGLSSLLGCYDVLMIHREQLLAQLAQVTAERDRLRECVELCAVAFEIGAPKQRDAAFAAIRAALV